MINLYNTQKDIKVLFYDIYGNDQSVLIRNGVFFSYVTGMNFRDNYGEFKEHLSVGEKVLLKPEPTNEVDPDAIIVLWNDRQIGYIPRKHIPVVMPCVDDEGTEAIIDKIEGNFVGIKIKPTFHMLGKRELAYNEMLIFEIEESNSSSMMYPETIFDGIFCYVEDDSVVDIDDESTVDDSKNNHDDSIEFKLYDKQYRETHTYEEFCDDYSISNETLFNFDLIHDDKYIYPLLSVSDFKLKEKLSNDRLESKNFYLCRKTEFDSLEIYNPDNENFNYQAYIDDIDYSDDDYPTTIYENNVKSLAMSHPESCILKLVLVKETKIISSKIRTLFFRAIIPLTDENLDYLNENIPDID